MQRDQGEAPAGGVPQPCQAPWGNAALAERLQPRTVPGAGGYLYEQHPDGTVLILQGPTGAGTRLQEGAAHAAITAEIGLHPGAACQSSAELDEEPECVGQEASLPLDIPLALATGQVGALQARVDALSDLARAGGDACEADRDFLHDLYWWIGVGGYGSGLPEAARLQHHYLAGSGQELEIGSEVYEESAIVQHAMAEMKKLMAADLCEHGAVRDGGVLCSTDVLGRTNLGDQERLGEILDGGYLLAEQGNTRLKYANNRFALRATAEVRQGWLPWQPDEYVHTEWWVEDTWDFASFAQQAARGRHDVSEIPLPGGARLSLPDGLSAWLVDQDIAATFAYSSSWTERWLLEEVPCCC